MDIWKMPYQWHWDTVFKNLRYCRRAVKWSAQRVKRGWADCDVWNLDSSILDYLYGTIKHLADNHYGFPGDEKFPTDESWTAYLNTMADCFYRAQEDNEVYPTPEADKWWEWCKEHEDYLWNNKDEQNPYIESMCEEAKKLYHKRQKDLYKGLQMLTKVFHGLWD